MNQPSIRTAEPRDFPAIVALNADAVQWTSPMDLARLQQLHQWSDYHRVMTVDDQVVGFLLVMPHDVGYDSPNYLWFQQHHEHFLYVDRIVVSQQHAGQRLGSLLYQDLFTFAQAQGVSHITCEYNLQPMNFPSQKFHDRFGFKQVGSQQLGDGHKIVSMQVADVNAYLGGSDAK